MKLGLGNEAMRYTRYKGPKVLSISISLIAGSIVSDSWLFQRLVSCRGLLSCYLVYIGSFFLSVVRWFGVQFRWHIAYKVKIGPTPCTFKLLLISFLVYVQFMFAFKLAARIIFYFSKEIIVIY